MAFDTRQKRASVAGVGRPWYRNAHPSNLDAPQRANIGNTYSGFTYSDVVVTVSSEWLIRARRRGRR